MDLNRFELSVRGIKAQCWEGGQGRPLLLLHGSGPGAASPGTWRHVLEPLKSRFHLYVTDLIGFGESGRKREGPYFDPGLWLDQVRALMDAVPERELFMVGHSISGALALRIASEDPRVARLMTTATMGWSFLETIHTGKCWTFPSHKDDLRRTLEALMYDHSGITDDLLELRMKILNTGEYRSYFSGMFAGEKQQYIDAVALTREQLARVRCPTLLLHGRNDLLFPAEGTTLPLLSCLPQADAVLLAQCGHLPALEHPKKVADAMLSFFG